MKQKMASILGSATPEQRRFIRTTPNWRKFEQDLKPYKHIGPGLEKFPRKLTNNNVIIFSFRHSAQLGHSLVKQFLPDYPQVNMNEHLSALFAWPLEDSLLVINSRKGLTAESLRRFNQRSKAFVDRNYIPVGLPTCRCLRTIPVEVSQLRVSQTGETLKNEFGIGNPEGIPDVATGSSSICVDACPDCWCIPSIAKPRHGLNICWLRLTLQVAKELIILKEQKRLHSELSGRVKNISGLVNRNLSFGSYKVAASHISGTWSPRKLKKPDSQNPVTVADNLYFVKHPTHHLNFRLEDISDISSIMPSVWHIPPGNNWVATIEKNTYGADMMNHTSKVNIHSLYKIGDPACYFRVDIPRRTDRALDAWNRMVFKPSKKYLNQRIWIGDNFNKTSLKKANFYISSRGNWKVNKPLNKHCLFVGFLVDIASNYLALIDK